MRPGPLPALAPCKHQCEQLSEDRDAGGPGNDLRLEPALERGRRRRRIGLDVQRDELALAVERIGALALSASIPTGQGKRDLGFLRMNQRFYLRVQVDLVSWG